MRAGFENNIAGETVAAEGRPRWLNWLIGFGIWTALAIFVSIRGLLYYYRQDVPIPWAEVITSGFTDFYLWGAVSPLIFMLCRRFPVERARVARRVLLHLVLSFIFAFAVTQLSILFYWYLGAPNPERYPSLAAIYKKALFDPYLLHQNTLVYWMTLLAAHTIRYYRQLRARESQAARFTAETAKLSEQLAQAQLNALKMQVHPHFLFNTLNAISALLDTDVKAADRMIARLSEFLRMTLKSSEAPATTLEKELEFLRVYLEIEKIRFQDSLAVTFEVDPQVLAAVVPNLILQPLVENAVRHGIARQTQGGIIRIAAREAEDRLLIEIGDNGPGFDSRKTETAEPGVGLANTKGRLERFYGGDFTFEITDQPSARGTLVKLNLPCRFENSGDDSENDS
jgi:two-component system, LytTR family, sensor kinase